MSIDLTLEGLAIETDGHYASSTYVRFNDLYIAKHGSCLDNAMMFESKKLQESYLRLRARTFNRYALFAVYNYHRGK